jgi:hypothetical protein
MCKIEFEIPRAGFVTIKVVDIIGTHVKSLINSHREPGKYHVDFNNEELLPGKYYYKVILADNENENSNGSAGGIITQGKLKIGRE